MRKDWEDPPTYKGFLNGKHCVDLTILSGLSFCCFTFCLHTDTDCKALLFLIHAATYWVKYNLQSQTGSTAKRRTLNQL